MNPELALTKGEHERAQELGPCVCRHRPDVHDHVAGKCRFGKGECKCTEYRSQV